MHRREILTHRGVHAPQRTLRMFRGAGDFCSSSHLWVNWQLCPSCWRHFPGRENRKGGMGRKLSSHLKATRSNPHFPKRCTNQNTTIFRHRHLTSQFCSAVFLSRNMYKNAMVMCVENCILTWKKCVICGETALQKCLSGKIACQIVYGGGTALKSC